MATKIVDSSPKGKIARGITAVEAARKGRKEPALAHLVGAQTKPENLKVLLNGCRSRLAKLGAIRDAATAALADESAKIKAHYESEGYLPGEKEGQREDILGAPRRKAMIDRAIVTAKKVIYEAVQGDVTALMTQVLEDERKVKAARAAFPSMIALLMNVTLDSEKRHVYMQNLSAAGQAGLLGAAREALGNNDMALGAAVIASIENLPKRSRDAMTVSREDIAEALIHEKFYASVDQITIAEFVLVEANLAGREGLGRQRTSTDTVALGLRRTEAEKALGRPLTVEDTVWRNVVGHVEQKHEETKKPTATQEESAQRDADLDAFHAAVQAGNNTKALRIGKKYGWIEEGDEE